MDQLDKQVYEKIIAGINEDSTSKNRGDYFIIEQSQKFGRTPGLLARVGAHMVQGTASFTEGMISYPITWWAANIHLVALSGVFGTRQKQLASVRQLMFTTLIKAIFKFWPRSARAILTYQKHKIVADPIANSARLAGRYAGSKITNAYLLKGLKNKTAATYIGLGSNFLYAAYGAIILAIAHGARSLENTVWAAISGEYNFPMKQTLKKIAAFEATDEELEEAFGFYKPFFEQIYFISHKKYVS